MLNSRFAVGDEIRVIRPIRNDGTYPGMERGAKLIRRGSIGVVQDIGTFLQDQVIYAVHFLEEKRLVGCREEEVMDANTPWIFHEFDTRDWVQTRYPLAVGGEVYAQAGQSGQIMKVLNETEPVHYHVLFKSRVLVLPETFLDPLNKEEDDANPAVS